VNGKAVVPLDIKGRFRKKNCHPDRSEAEWRDLLFCQFQICSLGRKHLLVAAPTVLSKPAPLNRA
jgi:hypothetical protein